jgi:hypothetical protein
MGRFVDLNKPLSEDDIEYLRSRGRSYLLDANFRRFGTPDEPREPEEHESVVGSPAQSPFYQSEERAAAVYDKGGAPLPNTTLDYDTGRVFDRENGVTALEFNPIGHTAGAHPSPFQEGDFNSVSADGDDFDDDIVEKVISLSDDEIEKELKSAKVELPHKESASSLNVEELKEKLQEEEVPIQGDYKKTDLVKALNEKFEKNHRERLEDALAVHWQDERDAERKAQEEAEDQSPDFAESDHPV